MLLKAYHIHHKKNFSIVINIDVKHDLQILIYAFMSSKQNAITLK